VRYDARDPERARVATVAGSFGLNVFSVVMGALCLGSFVLVLIQGA